MIVILLIIKNLDQQRKMGSPLQGRTADYRYIMICAMACAVAMVAVQIGYAGLNVLSKVAMGQGMDPIVLVAYRQMAAFLVITPLAIYSERYVRLIKELLNQLLSTHQDYSKGKSFLGGSMGFLIISNLNWFLSSDLVSCYAYSELKGFLIISILNWFL